MATKQKILIVADDNNIAELISLYLTKECYDTKIVNDGEAALVSYEHYNPNLILLDLMLPGIDGYQVCREIRTRSNVPIIMLSAKGEIFDKVLGLELGADDYIMKPFDSKELVARVKAVLRRFQPAKQDILPRFLHFLLKFRKKILILSVKAFIIPLIVKVFVCRNCPCKRATGGRT